MPPSGCRAKSITRALGAPLRVPTAHDVQADRPPYCLTLEQRLPSPDNDGRPGLKNLQQHQALATEGQMKFNNAVEAIGTVLDLRRIAGAHVIDHRQLSQDELRAALVKVRPQYLHEETVRTSLDRALFRENDIQLRVLSRLILIDVLLDQYDFELPFGQTEEAVMTFEQSVVNRSNEIDLVDLACANRRSPRHQNLELYQFVLTVAWENDDTKTPDEVHLLRRLRNRLGITESDHRLMEAKLGKYPKKSNELHTRAEITEARRYLQSLGLLFAIRRDDEVDADLIPEELAAIMRNLLGLEIRTDSYRSMMNYRLCVVKPT